MIEIWQNQTTGAPSVQVGRLTMDLGKKETPLEARLFELVMNHPDAVAAGAVRAPLTEEIASALQYVIQEYLAKVPKKQMGHVVEVSVEPSD